MTTSLQLKPLLEILDALSLEVTSRTVLAHTASTNNEAIGALVRVSDFVADMAALIRTVESLHQQRLFVEGEGAA